MRVLLQRVSRASVTVEGEVVGAIGPGYLIFLGVAPHDTRAEADYMVSKILELRLFSDEAGKMNRSIQDVEGSLLVVSQFTLYADTRKGRRPSFTDAAGPAIAIPLYEYVVARLAESGRPVATGRFGADMLVDLQNDGPVTIWLEREPAEGPAQR
jgi:D-tyrosyl-tRNA(Tyr) deacylase